VSEIIIKVGFLGQIFIDVPNINYFRNLFRESRADAIDLPNRHTDIKRI
jgi:hypothetical protein